MKEKWWRLKQVIRLICCPLFGYAMVPTRCARLGAKLTVETSLGDNEATVVRKPLLDPNKDIPKS